jgi:putative PIN family toxin of toxin-antitoxin system
VLLSGLIWHGPPHALGEHIRSGRLTLVTSPALVAELSDVILRLKFRKILARAGADPKQLIGELRRLAEIVNAQPLPAPISRDSDDDAVLALAIASGADLVISGDHDLLVLGSHAGIPIVNPTCALAKLLDQG